MIKAVQFSLDYPSINCKQCRTNLQEDNLEPPCNKYPETCEVKDWDILTSKILLLYDRICPWGELELAGLASAMDDMEIMASDRRLARRCLTTIHRQIKEHQQQQQQLINTP